MTTTTPLALGTKQQQTLENLQSRYSIDLTKAGTSYIYSPDDTHAKLARTKLSEVLFQHLFNGGAKDEITHAIEFMFEIIELRSNEVSRRINNWDRLASQLPAGNPSTGGE